MMLLLGSPTVELFEDFMTCLCCVLAVAECTIFGVVHLLEAVLLLSAEVVWASGLKRGLLADVLGVVGCDLGLDCAFAMLGRDVVLFHRGRSA